MNYEDEVIIKLNDKFRTSLCGPIIFTSGAQSLDAVTLAAVLHLVKNHTVFTESSDPEEDHSSGTFEHDGTMYCWQIEYFDPQCEYHCDPTDPEIERVLTIMLASEY